MPVAKTTPSSFTYLLSIIIFLVLSLTACDSSDFTLTANAGEFQFVNIGKPAKSTNIDVKITLIDITHGTEWRPSAYIGVHQGESRSHSFQFFMLQNNNEDSSAIAGYRIIEDGEIIEQISISNVTIGEAARVRISIDDGLVTLTLDDKAPVEKQTSLKEVSLYASASSGSALFEVYEVGSDPIR